MKGVIVRIYDIWLDYQIGLWQKLRLLLENY